MKTPATTRPIKIALLDLYNGEPNQGIRAITEIVDAFKRRVHPGAMAFERFETRLRNETPDLSYDIFICSGGPGSPFDGEGLPWEQSFFTLIDALWNHNTRSTADGNTPKFVMFICHSFQMMCRHFGLGTVIERESESFGIFKTHQTTDGKRDPLFEHLSNPFYAADFRHWQVINPDRERLAELGASVIAIEKPRAVDAYERALMGIRLNPGMVGVQFHPEADPPGMLLHFQDAKRKENIVDQHGEDRYHQIIERLRRPEYLTHTYQTILPNFLSRAHNTLQPAIH